MRRLSLLTALFGSLVLSGPAFAGDDDQDSSADTSKDKKKKSKKADDDDDIPIGDTLKVDESDFKEEAPETEPKPKPVEDEAEPETEDELDFGDDENEEDDLKFTDGEDAQESVKPRQPGEDTAKLYRDTQKKCKDMTPDEEALVWEEYLKKYPKSLFRDRIDERMDELGALMFGERIPGSDKGARGVDAADRELNFAVPFSLATVDPRSRISVGVQWGFPSWFGGKVDAEYAFTRQFSAHALLGLDFAGPILQPGAKYAIIKSSRTGTILTGGLDVKLNLSPTFVAFRPSILFGQRFRVAKGLDIGAQIAADIETREDSDIRWNAGLHAELRPNDIISLFWEWSWDAKYISHPDVDDSFRFFTTTFGLKFNAMKARNEQGGGKLDVGVGAVFPYATNYWGFYAGGVDIMADYYL